MSPEVALGLRWRREFDPEIPDQQWEVWISGRFTGPAYPGGKTDEANGLSVDRVVLGPVE